MDKHYKIALAMILKDSEKLDDVARNLDSLGKFVDGIYYTITYKGDDVSLEAKSLAEQLKVYAISKGYVEPTISFFKWVYDFAAARNYNWEQVSSDYEFIIWCDADDIWRGADKLQEACKLCDSTKADSMFFNYIYSATIVDNKVKDILIEHLRERLIRNIKAYKWVGEIHETLIEQKATNKVDSQLCDVLHLSNDERRLEAMDRNIEILEKILEKQGNNQDPRIVYYLGKAYFDRHTDDFYVKAEELIKRYLEGSDKNMRSGWEEERAQAWEYLGEIARIKGHFGKAIIYLTNALVENPRFPQFYIDLALVYVYLKRYDKAMHWADLAQKIPYPKTTLVMNPRDMKVRLLEVYFNVAVNTDNVEKAHWAMERLKEVFPEDASVKERYLATLKAKDENETVHRIVMLTKFLDTIGEKEKVQYLLKAVPDGLSNVPVIASIRNDFAEPRVWKEKEIAIMCGKGFEKWSPDNLVNGIGGSEEAVIHMAKRLSERGYEVTVYADPPAPKDYDNVHYRPYFEFNAKDTFNILIGWRVPQFFENKWNAKKTYLWLHDVQNPLEYTEKRVANITKIFVLSEAHKKTLINDWNKGWLTDDKFLLTGNGIDIQEITEVENELMDSKKDPYRIIWTSSYDRGLDHLLKIWPDVKKEVPDANLHIFYGWNLFDTIFNNNPERQAWKAKINKMMEQDGITHHGRVGQHEILKETYLAGIWAYPTHFYEISCITAMKCQALGAIPVTTDFAALSETVQFGVKVNVDTKDIYDKDKLEEYKTALISELKVSPKTRRDSMMQWARKRFNWDLVAENWEEEFKK